VFVSKHFCGDATDIALRFIAAQLPHLADIHARVSVCIATCCHAKCSPGEYCNRPWVEQTLALSRYVWLNVPAPATGARRPQETAPMHCQDSRGKF
jgi:hypothetical protein